MGVVEVFSIINMKSEKEQERAKFIGNVQEVIREETGIRPSFEQIDGYVGDELGFIKPGSPPWMNIIHPTEKVKLN
jgi:hypothetical protein